jgi:peroxiredoxin/uncharacterized membrane protein YphA (DoxX/SURF4 family)
MDSLLVGTQLLLAAVFALAGTAKLFDLSAARQAAADFGVPRRAAPIVGVLLPIAELATAVALVFQPTARWGALAALVLLLAFVGGIANAMRLGKDVDCGCFGPVYSATAGTGALIRNMILAGLATFVVVDGPAPAIDDWVAARSAAELVAIGLGIALVGLAGVAWRLRSQNRSLRQAVVDAPASEGPEIQGLPPGSFAPQFALPDTQGRIQTLGSLLGRGQPLVLVFFDRGCQPCHDVSPSLARWQRTLSDWVTIAVVMAVSAEENVATENVAEANVAEPTVVEEDVAGENISMWDEHGLANVLFDNANEVAGLFRLRSTPIAVILDPRGTIASTPTGGQHGVEVVVRLALTRALRGEWDAADGTTALPTIIQVPASAV